MKLFAKNKWMIVALAAFSFRSLFILWGWSDWHVIQKDTLSATYIAQGYGLCAGYGYVRYLGPNWIPFKQLEKMAGESRVTPENAPRIDASKLMPETLHPPGMAILNAVIHKVVGTQVDLPLEILGAILDSIAACLVYYMVAKFFNPRVGFVTGMIYAFYPPLAYASTVGRSPDGLMAIFVVGCLLCVLISSRYNNYRSYLWCFLGGLILALGSYLRPDYLFLPVFIGMAYWIYTRMFWKSLVSLLIVQTVVIILLVPWAYRNYQLCGRWIFTSSAVGATLYGSLGVNHNPWGIIGLDEALYKKAKAQGYKSPWTPEADEYFRNLFWESIKSKPMGYVMVIVKRIPAGIIAPQLTGYDNPCKTMTFGQAMAKGQDRFEVVMTKPLYIIKAYWDVILISLINLFAFLSCIYMVIKEKNRIGIVLLLFSPHISSLAMHFLTHLEPRYVLPSMFSLFIGLAYVLCRAWRDDVAFQTAPISI